MFDSVCQDYDWHCVIIFPATLWSSSLITRLVQTNQGMLTHTQAVEVSNLSSQVVTSGNTGWDHRKDELSGNVEQAPLAIPE